MMDNTNTNTKIKELINNGLAELDKNIKNLKHSTTDNSNTLSFIKDNLESDFLHDFPPYSNILKRVDYSIYFVIF